MAFKCIVFAGLLAVANAGLATYGIAAPAITTYGVAAPALGAYAASPYASVHAPAVASAHTNTYRGIGGQSSVTHYAKALDSAFSSVRKSDVRVTNDAVAYAPAHVGAYHAAPIAAYHATPAIAAYHATPAIAAYQAAPTVATYHATPAVAAYQAAPVAAYARAPISVSNHGGLLGVAYSPATAVAHISYDAAGIHYAY